MIVNIRESRPEEPRVKEGARFEQSFVVRVVSAQFWNAEGSPGRRVEDANEVEARLKLRGGSTTTA